MRPVPTELELLCDVSEALYVANQEDEDADGLLFELIAVFDDLLRAVKLTFRPSTRPYWLRWPSRLGEAQEFASFLAESGLTRERLEDALLWCVGAVTAKSSWVE